MAQCQRSLPTGSCCGPSSRGLPRAVNNVATQALVAAYAANKSLVDESSARAAATEMDTE
jgi:hypothetical protein